MATEGRNISGERPGWPAPAQEMTRGRRFLSQAVGAQPVVVAYHGDVDGLTAGLLVVRALHRLGQKQVLTMYAGKGEGVHSPTMRQRIARLQPGALVVVDMGSRGEPILPDTPTLVIDHHQPRGFPPRATVVSAHGHPPIAPTSLLALMLVQPLAPMQDQTWLALLGTVADLGADAPFPEVRSLLRQHRRKDVTEAVALLNAAKRSTAHDVETAYQVLQGASGPADIAQGRVEGVDLLRQYREEVKQEVARCSRTAPRFSGGIALLRFSSATQVHPLVATRWAQRLRGHVVLAANYGYLPGRVNFSLRSAEQVDLIGLLRGLGDPHVKGEFAYGHARATGGSLPTADFHRLLERMGFGEEDRRTTS